ncbi:MAG: hypothetical protein HY662_04415 [Chloroflexi bacterium]|nr:hypothetical protein [Chloroflexota bacterium]
MVNNDERFRDAVKRTEILRAPKQSLYTFGTTNIYYYLVTEPVYSELTKSTAETVIREGRVIAERPKIVTPYYLSRLEGFSTDARKYLEALIADYGASSPGLFYTYKNEPKELNIVSDNLLSVVEKLNADIDKRNDPLAAIIKGEDSFWDVSLMRFIFEMTTSSLKDNLRQLGHRRLLDVDSSGVPLDARIRIDELFDKVARGESEPGELKAELDRWGVFDEYEDRFLNIFKKKL